MAYPIEISLKDGGFIRLTAESYEVDQDEDGVVVLQVGKTRHRTSWTSTTELRRAIDGKRAKRREEHAKRERERKRKEEAALLADEEG